MITKDNKKQYDALFGKINKLMGYEGDEKILDINDYFTALQSIKDNVINKEKDFDPYFLILPNDEEPLKINANTREISVPDIFKTGVGVQGDELAEIIYFSIDRYFDTTDLYNKDIFVQWEAPNGDKGLSVTINKTLFFEPGKVVFGWPITSEMTKQAGYLKFAVRFYERENSEDGTTKLIYSFSTLNNQVKINPALDFTIDTKEDEQVYGLIDKNATIYKMMRNSDRTTIVDVPAAVPVFDLSAYMPSDFEQEYDVGETFEGKVLFEENENESAKGHIKYIWHKKDKTGKDMTIDGQYIAYKPTQDTSRNPRDQYFVKTKDGDYVEYSGTIPSEDEQIIYKLYASYAPKAAGSYYVIASNSAGRGNEAESEKSKIWRIAYPKAPIITYPEGIKNTIMSEESVTLTPSISGDGQLTYQWFKLNEGKTEFVKIDGETESSLTIVKKDDDSQEGYYKVNVTNSKNAESIELASEQMRVTLPASDLPAQEELLRYTNNKIYNSGLGTTVNSTLKVLIPESLKVKKSDGLSYQWYYAPYPSEDEDPEYTALPNGNVNETYQATQKGYYYVKIINIYNLDRKEVDSAPFSVHE